MADTFTTRLTLTKPEVGASTDSWGTKLNANFDSVDGLFDAGPALKVVNGGTGATSAGSARTNLGLGTMATQDASAVAITGGTATLTGTLTLSDTQPKMFFYESDAETNEKYWRVLTTEGQFAIQPFDDSLSSGSNAVVIARTGITVDSITLTATTVAVTGNQTISGTLTVGGSPIAESGSFTANLRASDGGTVLTSGTAYWKKSNGVVTLLLPALTSSGSGVSFYIDSLPSEIRATSNIYLTAHGYSDGAQGPVRVQVVANDDILFVTKSDAAAFTSSAVTKGIAATVLTWIV